MQLDYRTVPLYGAEGEKSDSTLSTVISATNTDSNPISVGYLVAFGAEKGACQNIKSKDNIEKRALGIVLSHKSKLEFGPGESLSILRQGHVYVHLDSDVKAPGDSVYVNSATGALGGAKAQGTVQLPRACFLSSGKAGDVIEAEINLLGGL